MKYMAKPTDKYKNKDAWQAMMKKGGGTQPEAKKLAEKFQEEVVAVMLEKNELDAENKVIADKDIEGTKPKKRTDKPSNFVSNQDFNPGSLAAPQEPAGRSEQLLDRNLPARTERQRRSERHDGYGTHGHARRSDVPRLGTRKPRRARSAGCA